jgi:hypothetical protein
VRPSASKSAVSRCELRSGRTRKSPAYTRFSGPALPRSDHAFSSRQGGGHWFEPSIARSSSYGVRSGICVLVEWNGRVGDRAGADRRTHQW